MNKIMTLMKLCRAQNLLIASFVVLEVTYLLNISFTHLAVICIIMITSFMASGYITNNIIDLKTDYYNQKLQIKNISIKECMLYNVLFLAIGVFCSLFIGQQASILLYSLLLPLLYLYNYYLKGYPLIGNMVVSFLLGMVFIITEVVINSTYHIMLFPAIFAFCLSFIREVSKDLEDYQGDMKENHKTLPIILGKEKTIYFISLCVILLSIFFYIHAYLTAQSSLYLLSLTILIQIPLLYSLFLLVKFFKNSQIYRLPRLYKIVTINGLIIILLMKGQL